MSHASGEYPRSLGGRFVLPMCSDIVLIFFTLRLLIVTKGRKFFRVDDFITFFGLVEEYGISCMNGRITLNRCTRLDFDPSCTVSDCFFLRNEWVYLSFSSLNFCSITHEDLLGKEFRHREYLQMRSYITYESKPIISKGADKGTKHHNNSRQLCFLHVIDTYIAKVILIRSIQVLLNQVSGSYKWT